MKKLFLLFLLLPVCLFGQYFYHSKPSPAASGNPAIPINFHRFGTNEPDWNNASQDPRIVGQKISNLLDENGAETGYQLWVDTATTENFLSGGFTYSEWPGNVSARQWASDTTWSLSFRNLPPNTEFEFEIYASNQSYHNSSVKFTVDGVVHTYNNINQADHPTYTLTTFSDGSGKIVISIYGSPWGPIAALKFKQL